MTFKQCEEALQLRMRRNKVKNMLDIVTQTVPSVNILGEYVKIPADIVVTIFNAELSDIYSTLIALGISDYDE